jgi:hypothetical protein
VALGRAHLLLKPLAREIRVQLDADGPVGPDMRQTPFEFALEKLIFAQANW